MATLWSPRMVQVAPPTPPLDPCSNQPGLYADRQREMLHAMTGAGPPVYATHGHMKMSSYDPHSLPNTRPRASSVSSCYTGPVRASSLSQTNLSNAGHAQRVYVQGGLPTKQRTSSTSSNQSSFDIHKYAGPMRASTYNVSTLPGTTSQRAYSSSQQKFNTGRGQSLDHGSRTQSVSSSRCSGEQKYSGPVRVVKYDQSTMRSAGSRTPTLSRHHKVSESFHVGSAPTQNGFPLHLQKSRNSSTARVESPVFKFPSDRHETDQYSQRGFHGDNKKQDAVTIRRSHSSREITPYARDMVASSAQIANPATVTSGHVSKHTTNHMASKMAAEMARLEAEMRKMTANAWEIGNEQDNLLRGDAGQDHVKAMWEEVRATQNKIIATEDKVNATQQDVDSTLTEVKATREKVKAFRELMAARRHEVNATQDLVAATRHEVTRAPTDFWVDMEVGHFTPDEITVTAAGDCLTVRATHEESAGGGTTRREFFRQCVLPRDISPERLHSTLSRDGHLTIKLNKERRDGRLAIDTHRNGSMTTETREWSATEIHRNNRLATEAQRHDIEARQRYDRMAIEAQRDETEARLRYDRMATDAPRQSHRDTKQRDSYIYTLVPVQPKINHQNIY